MKMKYKKSLVFCDHGFVVLYELLGATMMPYFNCHHLHWDAQPMRSIKDVIKKVETISQPKKYKSFHLGKWQFSIVKYD